MAATLFCAGVDFGLLNILDAKVATRAEVCSLVGFLADIGSFLGISRVTKKPDHRLIFMATYGC